MKKLLLMIVLVGNLYSCAYFKKNEITEKVIARGGDTYLYESDLEGILSENASKEDSTTIINGFINTWAKKQVLVERAAINLDEEKIEEFEKLVTQYRADLLIAAYKEALVNERMDTLVTYNEMQTFYEANKENFKLNEQLVQLRYIRVNADYSDLPLITEMLERFNEEDKEELDRLSLQFKSFSLNDSTWVKVSQLLQKVPPITMDNKSDYLKKSQFFELTDSLEVYLIQVKDVLNRNDIAPQAYVSPTLKQIILNKRKLEFIRDLEKELINEAIQKKQYEIYENNR